MFPVFYTTLFAWTVRRPRPESRVMSDTTKPTWNLAFDIKEARRREEEIVQQMRMLQVSLDEVRAKRVMDEKALCGKLKKAGGVLVAHEMAFWTPDGKYLEVGPVHSAFAIEDLCNPEPVEALEQPESFADACLTEITAV